METREFIRTIKHMLKNERDRVNLAQKNEDGTRARLWERAWAEGRLSAISTVMMYASDLESGSDEE